MRMIRSGQRVGQVAAISVAPFCSSFWRWRRTVSLVFTAPLERFIAAAIETDERPASASAKSFWSSSFVHGLLSTILTPGVARSRNKP
jgi:hypothetical protein